MEKRLTTVEAAQQLKEWGTPFSSGTLEVWRCKGVGPKFIRLKRKIFYELLELEKFAKGQVVETIDSRSV
jgi:hypothetical protein